MKGKARQRERYSALGNPDIGDSIFKYSFGNSDNGWIDGELYFDWIKTKFEPETCQRYVNLSYNLNFM